MANLFPKWTNKLPTIGAGLAAFGAPVLVFFVRYYFSPLNTDVGYQPIQPVPYSHQLHVGKLGMDCRYCHYTVDKAAYAAIPSSETCMNCHSQVKLDSPQLKPVRDSYESGKPVEWIKVHMLPDYAYFNHAVHVTSGVGCSSCHGRVDQMEIVWQAKPLSMGWCLECHRNPDQHIRPLEEVTNMKWEEQSLEARLAIGSKLRAERNLNPPTHCSACHR